MTFRPMYWGGIFLRFFLSHGLFRGCRAARALRWGAQYFLKPYRLQNARASLTLRHVPLPEKGNAPSSYFIIEIVPFSASDAHMTFVRSNFSISTGVSIYK